MWFDMKCLLSLHYSHEREQIEFVVWREGTILWERVESRTSLLTQLAVFRLLGTITTSVHLHGMEMYGFDVCFADHLGPVLFDSILPKYDCFSDGCSNFSRCTSNFSLLESSRSFFAISICRSLHRYMQETRMVRWCFGIWELMLHKEIKLLKCSWMKEIICSITIVLYRFNSMRLPIVLLWVVWMEMSDCMIFDLHQTALDREQRVL